MAGDFATLTLSEPGPGILEITLNRPDAANAINTEMGRELWRLFDALNADPARARAVILTGAGSRTFCAGGDLKERLGMSNDAWQAQHLVFERMVRAIVLSPMPLIAAVNGAAFGGGCELALLADFAYAAESARFALTEVTLGIMPGAGGTQTLPRAIGIRRAKEILLTGRPFSAAEAAEWGLVNRVCSPASLLEEARATATTIAGNAPLSTRQIKQAVNVGIGMDLPAALMLEIEAYNRLVPTEDRREGVCAFNEKRRPRFAGR
ncbi:MAG: enoyl-CoA hydratase-related protein [Rhodospirillales bacterium]|nr:enoyl-CoA hydratase-related protein [Rhodospirillales bacterium]